MSSSNARLSAENVADAAAVDLVLAEADALRSLAVILPSLLPNLIEALMTTTGKVITIGVGTSGAIARRMAHLLSLTGTPALYVHPSDGVHGSLGAVAVGDTVLALSKGGDSDEVNTFAGRASVRGARVVAVTTRTDSPLATIADVVVALPQVGQEDPGGIIAMGSTLAVAALGDAVALTLMQRRGYSWDSVLYAHPGGAVGKRADRGDTP